MIALIVTLTFALHPGAEIHLSTHDTIEECHAAAEDMTIYYASEQPGDKAWYNCVEQ